MYYGWNVMYPYGQPPTPAVFVVQNGSESSSDHRAKKPGDVAFSKMSSLYNALILYNLCITWHSIDAYVQMVITLSHTCLKMYNQIL
jgi:hypothetical protein